MCNFAQTITGLILVKCEVLEISVGSIKNKNKKSVNWAALRLHLSEVKQEWVLLTPALQSKLTLMHFFYMTSTTSI